MLFWMDPRISHPLHCKSGCKLRIWSTGTTNLETAFPFESGQEAFAETATFISGESFQNKVTPKHDTG